MEIVDVKEYRSKSRKVNQSCDRLRITIDMSKNNYYRLLSFIKQEKRDENI